VINKDMLLLLSVNNLSPSGDSTSFLSANKLFSMQNSSTEGESDDCRVMM
jgi:hypothetical protein